jgi:ABC-type branched-subunit amino acid transport system ATPase component
MTAPPALEARHLTRRFGGVLALDDVSLTAAAGEISALVGPNGAGKSTLFHCLAGSLRADSGSVLLDGRDISRLPADARSRRGLIATYQQGSVFPSLTVRENLLVAAENRRRSTLVRALLGRASPAAGRVTDRALATFRLGQWRDVPAADLPTGMVRLVEIARAYAAGPRVLLLDEPVSGLNRAETGVVAEVLRNLADGGVCVLLVEHDRDFVEQVAERVSVLAVGRIVAAGSFTEVQTAWSAA